MNAGSFRNTRFEIKWLEQHANHWTLTCSARDPDLVNHKEVVLDVAESRFSDEEMQQIHDVLGLLETRFADAFDAHDASPKALLERLAEMRAASESLAEAREAQAAAEGVTRAKLAEIAQLDDELAVKQASLAALNRGG